MNNKKNVNNIFQKATKTKSKLRLALFGASGAGKTYSALRIASGIGGKIAVIDSEFGTASKYADKFNFDVVNIEEPKIENYVEYIESANGYDVLIIDSLTHGWQELLEEIDKLAKAKFGGNTWSAWSEGTPKQKKMIRAIQTSKCHIIATMRAKTEWKAATDEKSGKFRLSRQGLAPEQGKGIEYEFDMLMEITPEHYANILKDRSEKFQDLTIEKPDESFGAELKAWLNEGEIPLSDVMVLEIQNCATSENLEFIKEKCRKAAREGRLNKANLTEIKGELELKESEFNQELAEAI